MISIIVCSINELLFSDFKKSIYETISGDFEIIRIDNTNNIYGICEAYNKGAAMAKSSYLCFAHEDILIKTKNWDLILKTIFEQNTQTGIIGVAGSKYKSLSPGGWPNGVLNLDRYNFIQCNKDEKTMLYANPDNNDIITEVKTLDGVFLFTKKEIWENNKFDAVTFKGFHNYDLDFCLKVGLSHKLFVCYQVLIEHLSSGSENANWIKDSILLSKKWKAYLPVGELAYQYKTNIEWHHKRMFALKMAINNFSLFNIVSVFLGFGYIKYFNLKGNLSFLREFITSISKKLILKFKT